MSTEARPPSGPGDNGEEVLLDDSPQAASDARRQADEITSHRMPSGTGNPPSGEEGQRQHEPPRDGPRTGGRG